MPRAYHIFRERTGQHHALPSGWAWSALPLPWLWAFGHQLWLRGLVFLLLDAVAAFLAWTLLGYQPVAIGLLLIIPRVVALFNGTSWAAAKCEERELEYLGEIVARGRKDAISQVARRNGIIPEELRARPAPTGFSFPPRLLQRLWAVARLTWRAAFRYRLVVVLIALLLAAVVVLPSVIKHDGTAQGFTQILLTYTLGITTALLSLVTLWLACGTLARDVDEAQMQVVATKPIPRWEIWIGKWTGIFLLNAMLLAVSAGAVYLLMQWRATQLPPEVQQALRSNVLTARASVREPMPDLEARVDQLIREQVDELRSRGVDLQEFRQHALEALKARAGMEVVPPEHYRQFRLDLSRVRDAVKDQPFFVALKFHTPVLGPKRPYELEVIAGPPDSPRRVAVYQSLAAETVHEIALGTVELDGNGILWVDVANRSDTPLIFPVEDGFQVLYREGGFGLNYIRAVLVILCWLGLLAAIGLAAASFLSFPVAAFLATTVLILGLSTGTLKTVVEDRTVLGFEHDSNERLYPAFDAVMLPVFQALLWLVNLVQQFSPIDAVSSGRSITWGELARAVALIVLMMGGVFAAVGITTFTRRELATAQSNL
jgi:hypothetical protein